jgi:glycosidase
MNRRGFGLYAKRALRPASATRTSSLCSYSKNSISTVSVLTRRNDTEQAINRFVGRHSPDSTGFGIDAALDYPLFLAVPDVVKGWRDVGELPGIFERRKKAQQTLISSHGEAGQYFVTFLDDHDQIRRFNQPSTPQEQVTMGLALLFCLQGIPAIYYGTEQGLTGTVDSDGNPGLVSEQSVREALWASRMLLTTKTFSILRSELWAGLGSSSRRCASAGSISGKVSGNNQDFG